MTLETTIKSIEKEFHSDIKNVVDLQAIDVVHVKYLGKKGLIASLMSALKSVDNDQKPFLGKLINDLKNSIEQQIIQLKAAIEEKRHLKAILAQIILPLAEQDLARLFTPQNSIGNSLEIIDDLLQKYDA